jgi:hypothetical protein
VAAQMATVVVALAAFGTRHRLNEVKGFLPWQEPVGQPRQLGPSALGRFVCVSAVLYAAQHDQGIHRLHALT